MEFIIDYIKMFNYRKIILPFIFILLFIFGFMYLNNRIDNNQFTKEDLIVRNEDIFKEDKVVTISDDIFVKEFIFIDIKGAVKNPGVYKLEKGSRVIYPISQAADITAFKGELVPVGEDQLPLIEQCREIVRKFNSIYGETLKEPEAYLSKTTRIKGLDGNDKMGKSLGNAIYLRDDEETITKKIMGAVTDTNKIKKDDPADPSKCMVYYYHDLINSKEKEQICEECKKGSRGCVQCKKELIKNMIEFLKPIQEKGKYYEDHPELVNEILLNGTKKAQEVAKKTMKEVKKAIKIDYYN